MKIKDTRKEKRGTRKKKQEGCYQTLVYGVFSQLKYFPKKTLWHFFPGLSIFLSII